MTRHTFTMIRRAVGFIAVGLATVGSALFLLVVLAFAAGGGQIG